MLASGDGSSATGYCLDGVIQSLSGGGHASGYSDEGGAIEVTIGGKGGHSSGYATEGSISVSGIGGHASGYTAIGSISVTGNGGHAFGHASSINVNLPSSIVSSGQGSQASGSALLGSSIESSGFGSIANGYASINSNISAIGFGSIANGYSFNNEEITVSGDGAFAGGRHLINDQNYSMIIGQYGRTLPNRSVGLNSISGVGSFQIAGGTSSAATLGTDSLSVVIGTQTFADVGATGGGFAEFWNTNGADYAEYFEWEDGNPNDEDRVGYFAELIGDKIRKADSGLIIGVTSSSTGTSGVTGDCAEVSWNNALLRDEFGRVITELKYKQVLLDLLNTNHIDMTEEINNIMDGEDNKTMVDKLLLVNFTVKHINNVPIFNEAAFKDKIKNIVPLSCGVTNPNYDPTKKYVPRSARKEWIPVGMLGKLYVRDNGECVVGQYCDCLNGIAVPGSKWMVMARSSANVIKILLINV